MAFLLHVCVFALGTIFGSFINVLVIRGNTGRSVGGRSACMSCGRQLTVRDLVPIVSYIFLRGACRTCGSRISIQYPLVEAAGGLVSLYTYLYAADITSFFVLYAVGLVLLYTAVYDIRHTIIPDGSITILAALGIFWGITNVCSGYSVSEYLLQVGISVCIAAIPFVALWFFSSGRAMGFGDVKLAGVLGLFLPVSESVAFVWLSFVLGGAISVGILGVQKLLMHTHALRLSRPLVTMKSEIPFGPFLAISFFVVALFGIDMLTVLGWFSL